MIQYKSILNFRMETRTFLFFYIYIVELLINQILDNKIDKYIPILSNSK